MLENSASAACSSEDLSKQVEWIMESTSGTKTALLKGGVAVAVVCCTFLRIAQRLVCLAQFLKSLFSSMIPGFLSG